MNLPAFNDQNATAQRLKNTNQIVESCDRFNFYLEWLKTWNHCSEIGVHNLIMFSSPADAKVSVRWLKEMEWIFPLWPFNTATGWSTKYFRSSLSGSDQMDKLWSDDSAETTRSSNSPAKHSLCLPKPISHSRVANRIFRFAWAPPICCSDGTSWTTGNCWYSLQSNRDPWRWNLTLLVARGLKIWEYL